MSDIFQEVDEEVRRERLQKLWERYQGLIIAGVILILAGVGGWRGYDWYQAKRTAETGTAFEAAGILAEANKPAEAEAAFAKIAAEGTANYRGLARIRGAAEAAKRDPKAGIEAYDAIANDGAAGADLRDLAGVRAGALMIEAGSFKDAQSRLEPLATDGRAYRATARELLALTAWKTGDFAATRRWYELMVTDLQTPPATRDRVEILMALIAAENKG